MDKDYGLGDHLSEFRFGATIEATNGIGDAYGRKAKQALAAKEFLESLTEREVHVAAGLAYLVSKRAEVDQSLGINFIINVDRYNSERLENALVKVLELPIINGTESRLIEATLKKKDIEWDLPGFYANSFNELRKRAKYIGMSFAEYSSSLSVVKGFAMEFYISYMFEEELDDFVLFHRFAFNNMGKKSDADLVIICRENRFYGALQRLNTRPEITTKVLTRKI